MSQAEVPNSHDRVGELNQSVGYLLKQASVALRAAMDAVLRPMDLSVPQYSCLELLGQQPGLSNAQLARGAFVTRQSMNGVLIGLEERGLVMRPDFAPQGRMLPTELTNLGRARLVEASTAVRAVERRMIAGLDTDGEASIRLHLHRVIDTLA